jgi:hypothetical protein
VKYKIEEKEVIKVKTKIDTQYFNKDIKTYTEIPVYHHYYDTLRKSEIYTSTVKDSLIEGTITSEIKDCKLIKQNINYVPLFPKYIHRTDSVFIEKTITKTEQNNYWSIYGGFNFTAPEHIGIYPTIGFKSKNDRYFELGYDPFKNNIQLGLKIKIIKK